MHRLVLLPSPLLIAALSAWTAARRTSDDAGSQQDLAGNGGAGTRRPAARVTAARDPMAVQPELEVRQAQSTAVPEWAAVLEEATA
jgi:hypothetical protein